jgi:hypothetical protein
VLGARTPTPCVGVGVFSVSIRSPEATGSGGVPTSPVRYQNERGFMFDEYQLLDYLKLTNAIIS